MRLFNGKLHATKIKNDIKQQLSTLKLSKKLAIVIIGSDPASFKYVQLKERLCQELSIPIEVCRLAGSMADSELYNKVQKVFSDPDVGGGIIQLPLPRETLCDVLDTLPESKDIDLLSKPGLDKFYAGDLGRLSPVVRAFSYFLAENNFDLFGKRVTVIGYGELVGKPLEFFCKNLGAVTQIVNDYHTSTQIDTDFLILSSGVSNLVKGENISRGCSVVDFGYSVVNGKTVGDLDMKSRLDHLDAISPSPGGMGPLVVCFFVKNFLDTLNL
ncbi:hypothetical protein A3K42_01010 [candidate division WWE3 bacterium RBG_13_37_7]|uniref:Methenyltetrahydrofolate cyclohydrolase n=1 Tax=candidate division WWE3 bacterium RBG_13_37_7 TaxID=1802609 RepID=A0A1F4U0K0_UNCKA|nr:MAG: hypothetical protein A3K42_01010 [candidate division WWE3 bacterium RBG_13_37_7]